jgi:HSP20 family molecular chaperone IbpA
MSGIIRRTYHPAQLSSLFSDLDPFRVMEGLFRVAPSAEGAQRQLEFAPNFDVKETKDAFLFKADLPGVKEADLEIAHTGNRLTIGGKREAEERKEGEKLLYGGAELRKLPALVHPSRERRCGSDQSRAGCRCAEHQDSQASGRAAPKDRSLTR